MRQTDTKMEESKVIKDRSFSHNYMYDRVWATNSSSDMAQAVLNSSVSLRILYDTKHRFYVYSNADGYIHRDLIDVAWEYGLYPEYKYAWQYKEGHFEDHTYQLIYAPKGKEGETLGTNIMEDGYTDRIEYDFGVISGRSENQTVFLNKIPFIKALKSHEIKHTYFGGWNGDTPIIKELSESLDEAKEVEHGVGTFVTDSAHEMANILHNCKTEIRILFDTENNLYFYAEGYFKIHSELYTDAQKVLYFSPEDTIEDDMDSGKVLTLAWVSNNDLVHDKEYYERFPWELKKEQERVWAMQSLNGFKYAFSFDDGTLFLRGDDTHSLSNLLNVLGKYTEYLFNDKTGNWEEPVRERVLESKGHLPFRDVVGNDTLRKRAKYYKTHGIKNAFDNGLLENTDNSPLQPIPENYFIESTRTFDNQLKKCKIQDTIEDISSYLKSNSPQACLGSNIFKIRYKSPFDNRGKSGSYRIVYVLRDKNVCYLLSIYSKSAKDNLSKSELNFIKNNVDLLNKKK